MSNQSKEPHEREVFGIKILKPSHPQLRQLKKRHKPSFQGYKMWNSTWLLLDYLGRQGLPPASRLLDAGYGWGPASICSARRHGAQVTAIDIDPEVFPFLNLHAAINQVEIRTLEAGFEQISSPLLQLQDVLAGADICFKEQLVAPLYSLIEKALEAGVQQIVIADPGRRPFKKLCAECSRKLGALMRDWETPEPLIDWPGTVPLIRGHLLIIGNS